MIATAPQTGARGARRGASPPALGFAGLGWIGAHRLRSVLEAGAGRAAALADPSPAALAAARGLAPEAAVAGGFDELLDLALDGIVLATPSAQHAEQAIRALERGRAVFCQKPLGRTAEETAAVVEAARRADRLLHVDLSYRHVEGMRRIRDLVRFGALGEVFAVDLVFHNAYGPDKPWFRDVEQSGGGCVMDLGVHLVDLALWALGWPAVEGVQSRLFARGLRLAQPPATVEDYAVARLDVGGGAVVRLACSWNLQAGRDAVIEAAFYGTRGGAALRNIGGSFYDFVAERYRGTTTETIAAPPDAWGGRAVVRWCRRLAAAPGFDPGAERLVELAGALDRIYGRR